MLIRAQFVAIVVNYISRDLLKIQRLSLGSPKISNFWGEEKWRQAKLVCEFHLEAHFDEGAVAIHYGVPRIIRFYLDFLSPFGRTIISASLRARSSIILLVARQEH